MSLKNYRNLAVGFIGGIAFVVGCGGSGGGSSTLAPNTASANTATVTTEEKYCYLLSSGSVFSISQAANAAIAVNGQTIKQRYPVHQVFCGSFADDAYTETTLNELYAAGWRTRDFDFQATSDAEFKIWRYKTN